MEEEIGKAIKARQLISIYYEGEYRRLEPHVLGQDKSGKTMMRAYQVEGYSTSGEERFWKMFDIAKVEVVNRLPEHFAAPRYDYNPVDPVIKVVYCQL